MRTKIAAAGIAMSCGVTMYIANGRQPDVLADIASGAQIGTKFLPKPESMSGRKRWIAFGASPKGGIVVNDGARDAICRQGTSLLAVGITDVVGKFSRGDMVQIFDRERNQFARGFVNYNAAEIAKLEGRKSSEIETTLGYRDYDEIVHRDNMVVSESSVEARAPHSQQ
jgi:glutamate 5-kinase